MIGNPGAEQELIQGSSKSIFEIWQKFTHFSNFNSLQDQPSNTCNKSQIGEKPSTQ